MQLTIFRFEDSENSLDEIPGLAKFIKDLYALPVLTISEMEGDLSDLNGIPADQLVLLLATPAQTKLVASLPERLRRSVFLAGQGAWITEKMDEWQIAGVITDLNFRYGDKGYFAYGHQAIVSQLMPAKLPLVRHHTLFSLGNQNDPLAVLPEYLELYNQFKNEIWPLVSETRKEPVEETAGKKLPREKKSYGPDNSWQDKLKPGRDAGQKPKNGNPALLYEGITEEQREEQEREKLLKKSEEEKKEAKIPKQLREVIFSKTFMERSAVREDIQQKDKASLQQKIYKQLAASYCMLRFSKDGWPDLKIWTDVQFLQRVGKDKGALSPEEAGERKIVKLESGSSWAEMARVDVMLTKTLMSRLDPEVMMMIQDSPDKNADAAMSVLTEIVRPLLRKISSGAATVRIITKAGKMDNLNTSYWGNEKQVTLALQPGSEGWTDELPLTRRDVEEMTEEMMKTYHKEETV
ncbi:MAG: hypothetical protein FD123_2570 [Bacteroidetes bacterium]|nr:MAG: hypothetical protein FD123_2570 [Bacteroidota bacterium]